VNAPANPVLVVDDQEINRHLLSRRLRGAGFAVETASDGAEALRMIQGKEYELVLLDNMMPGLTGIDILRLLRATHSPESLPIIMVTSIADSANIVEAIELGANDYVTKPLDFPVALARIRSQVGRKVAERALKESEQRYALAAQGADDGLWDWDVRNSSIYFSPRWKSILGYTEEEVANQPEEWFSKLMTEDRSGVETAIRDYWSTGDATRFEHEHRMVHRDGTLRWVLCRGFALRDLAGEVVRMTGWLTDVTEARAYDSLTNLPNRLLFDDHLIRAVKHRSETQRGLFAVLFLDLDGFKLVNDSFGHGMGDQLLRAVAGRLRSNIRNSAGRNEDGIIARLGGDEFAILLDRLDSRESAERVADRIVKALRVPFHLEGRDIFCTVSIGIAMSDLGYSSAADIVRDADIAMYCVKAAGKGTWIVFNGEMRDSAIARLEVHNDLQRALQNNELEIYYQPTICLKTRRIEGFEALVRWNHPRRGLCLPAEFVQVAEENGTILQIGAWVLENACKQILEWNRHRQAGHELSVNVNVSPRQINSRGFVDLVQRTIESTGIAPGWLNLEVTEGVFLENIDDALRVLHSLKDLGVKLSVDDFGTGYSCLSYLCKLPFDTIKVDRSFIQEDTRSAANQELVRTILAMAHELGMDVVAEGIESEEQACNLNAMGCQFGQGFYFSKPVPLADTSALLAEGFRVERSVFSRCLVDVIDHN
jgi:diguanylate cyclase (GGDEF)-like protein/PAS domain S-box-containing protein